MWKTLWIFSQNCQKCTVCCTHTSRQGSKIYEIEGSNQEARSESCSSKPECWGLTMTSS